jgi:hypothetical protein
MKAVKFKEQNMIFATQQPQYMELPAHRSDDATGAVTTCYQLSFKERVKVLFVGRVWLQLLTFDWRQPLQPQRLSVDNPFKN